MWATASPSTTGGPWSAPASPAGDRRRRRSLEVASVAACVALTTTGWWLYTTEVENRVEILTRAGNELSDVQQERDHKSGRRLAMARRELRPPAATLITGLEGELQRALHQSEWLSAKYQELLAQERVRSQELEQQLEERRDDQELLEHERVRNQELEQQLAQDRDDQELLERERVRNQELEQQLAQRQDGHELLQQERIRNQELEAKVLALQDLGPSGDRSATANWSKASNRLPVLATDKFSTAAPDRNDKALIPAAEIPATTPARPTTLEAARKLDLRRLMTRASLLLSQGNVAAARIVLDHAAQIGSAEALFSLAETYDPEILSAWGTVGTQGDVRKAQELYAKALIGGVEKAKHRLNASHE
jgi:TPR repeat protein